MLAECSDRDCEWDDGHWGKGRNPDATYAHCDVEPGRAWLTLMVYPREPHFVYLTRRIDGQDKHAEELLYDGPEIDDARSVYQSARVALADAG